MFKFDFSVHNINRQYKLFWLFIKFSLSSNFLSRALNVIIPFSDSILCNNLFSLTVAKQWDLILSIQKPSCIISPWRLSSSFSWLSVKGRTRLRTWTMVLAGLRAGDGDLLALSGSSALIRAEPPDSSLLITLISSEISERRRTLNYILKEMFTTCYSD